jgi:hypothetical protein
LIFIILPLFPGQAPARGHTAVTVARRDYIRIVIIITLLDKTAVFEDTDLIVDNLVKSQMLPPLLKGRGETGLEGRKALPIAGEGL